ncbi:uncharacterized protein LOC107780842 [Nicotiana tabacum]|uniref:Telomere repeat-binding protein 4-like n=1 Tax=Nicotiana tabacum TaxID=4097 RepID=A0A1S3YXT3_TOBAC|nr:PREDICTED: uncharacterized protein LOC107780842 [Nicotiana tabacum]XP_016456928.1 PREDICTED: uncharacterized protein LOC107780842 [Nicotiana tabacum]XP_016456929.1 PREDICTED: uncharacterized protein LOC107780842 [Nicotiana tabacum]
MLGKVGQKCKMQSALDSLQYSSKTPNASASIFRQEPEQVVGGASDYFASEEEAIGVEHLLAEPEYDDIVDTLLDLKTCTFSVPESYFKDFSALESVDHDALPTTLTEVDETREKLLDGFSNGYDENYCSISCEDYLLDIEVEEETPTLHDVDISYIEDVNLENQLAGSDGKNCGIDVLKLSDARNSSDYDSLLLDNRNCLQFDDMSSDKLLEVFRKMFGHQTSVTDKQWLKHHITFGLQNQDMKCSLVSSEIEGAKVLPPESREELLKASTAFASVFNFRKKPRVQHVKRREHIQWNSFKCLSEAQVDSSGILSDQSNDNTTSEDDWTIGTETPGTNQNRKHNYWSTPEVLKLVDGVSKYGVGRWTDIKRLYFQSSAHRSPPDLKDKWRNLLRASRQCLKSRRGVAAKQNHGWSSIPHHVLNRVQELAVIYPYPRKRRARVLPTVFVASSSTESDNRCFSLNA